MYPSARPAVREGTLSKQSDWLGVWRTRTYKFEKSWLYFAVDKSSKPHMKVNIAKSRIKLVKASPSDLIEIKDQSGNVFRIRGVTSQETKELCLFLQKNGSP